MINLITALLFLCVLAFLAIGMLPFSPFQRTWLSILIEAVLALLLMWHDTHLEDETQ